MSELVRRIGVNRERMKLWIDALRSGGYDQGHGQLRCNGSWCCLGVAIDVAMQHGVDVPVETIPDREAHLLAEETRGYLYDGQSGHLPVQVRDWYGLNERNPMMGFDELFTSATSANDCAGKTFEEIADALERTYLNENDKEASE